MAIHMAAGFTQNTTSLAQVTWRMSTHCLLIAMSGIGCSGIKSLSVDIVGTTAMSHMLPIAPPPLKKFVVKGDRGYTHEEDIDDDAIFGCSIDELELRSVRVG
jgi:hypothetical protein